MPETLVQWFVFALQLCIALGLVNVWIFRFNRATKYRGKEAQNMKEEFAAYGLPLWSVYVVGFFKITIAVALIVSSFVPSLISVLSVPALAVLSVLMLGAIGAHIKVRDAATKTLPAVGVLSMALAALCLVLYF